MFLFSALFGGMMIGLTTSALTIPIIGSQDQNMYNFSIFQTPDCLPTLGGASKHSGDYVSASACSPALEWLFSSTQIYTDAEGRCNITFYRATGAGTGGTCSLPVASYPGDIELNTCYKFSETNRPVTFGVSCIN